MAGPRVAVVMPAYNEGEEVVAFVQEIERHIAPHAESLIFVIVDDASDPPLVIGSEVLGAGNLLDVLVNPENLGHGPSALRAYRSGLEHAADIVIHVDGDGQFLGEDFVPLLKAAQEGYAGHGVRTSRTDPWYRRMISRALRGALAGRGGQADVNTPFRAYPAATIAELLELVPDDALVPHVHFSLWEKWRGIASREIPVSHRVRRGEGSTGTMWQGSKRVGVLPPRRLVKFCYFAAKEVACVLVRRQIGLVQPPTVRAVDVAFADEKAA